MPHRIAISALLLVGTVGCGSAPAQETPPFRTQRLSERVLLLTEISPMENLVVALATEKGLVVVDATGSPYTAGLLRRVIEEAFGRDDFAYLVQTHYHWDHAWGNLAFPEATVIAHDGARGIIDADRVRLPDILDRRRQSLQEMESRMAGFEPGAPAWDSMEVERAFLERTVRGMEGTFGIRPPNLTFRDRMSLDLGDVTLRLTFFGRAHSGNDVVIQIPEEDLLLTGDLFLDRGWLPLFAGQSVLDIPRWISVLGDLLDGEDRVSAVVPGHRQPWTRERLDLWRGYIVELWEGVQVARAAGLTLDQAQARLPLGGRFDYLKELGHTDDELARFQRENVEAFWRQLPG